MKAIKDLKAPEGYIYNGRRCLMGWPWTLRELQKADPELFTRLKVWTAEDNQKIYKIFCAQFQERWGFPCPTEDRED